MHTQNDLLRNQNNHVNFMRKRIVELTRTRDNYSAFVNEWRQSHPVRRALSFLVLPPVEIRQSYASIRRLDAHIDNLSQALTRDVRHHITHTHTQTSGGHAVEPSNTLSVKQAVDAASMHPVSRPQSPAHTVTPHLDTLRERPSPRVTGAARATSQARDTPTSASSATSGRATSGRPVLERVLADIRSNEDGFSDDLVDEDVESIQPSM